MLAYFITKFDFETDISMEYPLKYRDIFYSEKDIMEDIKYTLENVYEDYLEIAGGSISYDKFYNKSYLHIEVGVISLNRRNMLTRDEYNNYLQEVKNVKKEDLLDYLLSFTDYCRLWYDHNLNLKDTYCYLLNSRIDAEIYSQFSFSYKSLFPEKYHVSKFKNGDHVKYNGEEYIIDDRFTKISIYDSDDPLNCLWGYMLFTEDGYCLQDDKFCYFVVDEDLE